MKKRFLKNNRHWMYVMFYMYKYKDKEWDTGNYRINSKKLGFRLRMFKNYKRKIDLSPF